MGYLSRQRLHGRCQGRRAGREGPRKSTEVPQKHQAHEGRVRPELCEESERHQRQEGQKQIRSGRADSRRHPQLQEEEQARPAGDGVVRVDRSVHEGAGRTQGLAELREGHEGKSCGHCAVDALRLCGDRRRGSLRERRTQPERGHPGARGIRARPRACRSSARISRPGRR